MINVIYLRVHKHSYPCSIVRIYAIKYRFPYRTFDQLSNDGKEDIMTRTSRKGALKFRYKSLNERKSVWGASMDEYIFKCVVG
jgi:hypothetical protein